MNNNNHPQSHLKILFVDNSRTTRAVMSALLEQHGYAVTAVGTGPEAIEKLKDRIKRGLTGSESRALEGEELRDFLDSQLISDYLLLAGYALECVLKGYLLTKRPELVKEDKRLNTLVTIHNLGQLCDNCEITLSDRERQVADVMTWQIQWGKYPAPKELKDMPSPVESSRLRIDVKGSVFHDRQVQNMVDDLYQRVCTLFESSKAPPA